MPKVLSDAQIAQFRKESCLFPIRVMPGADAAALRARLEDFERCTDEPLKGICVTNHT